MSTTKKLNFLICALILPSLVGCTLFWFLAPGVRRIGSFSRFNIQKTGYAIDPETMDILGTTEVTVEGNGSVFKKSGGKNTWIIESDFSGTVDVADYRNTDPEYFGTSLDYEDGMFVIRYLNSYFHVEDPETHTGHAGQITPFYTVYVIPERDDLVAVLVTDFAERQTIVVCTDDPGDALEECQWLKDRFGI